MSRYTCWARSSGISRWLSKMQAPNKNEGNPFTWSYTLETRTNVTTLCSITPSQLQATVLDSRFSCIWIFLMGHQNITSSWTTIQRSQPASSFTSPATPRVQCHLSPHWLVASTISAESSFSSIPWLKNPLLLCFLIMNQPLSNCTFASLLQPPAQFLHNRLSKASSKNCSNSATCWTEGFSFTKLYDYSWHNSPTQSCANLQRRHSTSCRVPRRHWRSIPKFSEKRHRSQRF